MGRVRVLSDDIVSLISAGEVIENPSSIVKELIENSLDAGADMIDIAIEKGGINRIVVSDNGTGILSEDCPVCINRHSTSKISTKEDIDSIRTYGFRGEALASIASVADIRIVTQAQEQDIGSSIIAKPGQTPITEEASRPIGTTVEVTDLFREIPARRKHLAEPRIEAQRVQEIIMKHATIRNDIGFRFTRDESVIIDCPPHQSARNRITYLWGTDVAKALADIDFKNEDIHISGFVARPLVSRGNRSREYFSVLKRPITDEKLSKCLESAFSTTLMKGQYPICSLNITVDVEHVDVNVHPTKREVRILEIAQVCDGIRKAIHQILRGPQDKYETSTLNATIQLSESSESSKGEIIQESLTGEPLNRTQVENAPMMEQTILEPLMQSTREDSEISFLGGVFRIIGQLHNLYILLEYEEGLLIIDQHAAHERVLYEELRKEVNENRVAVQELLQPFVLSLSPKDIEQIGDLTETLAETGFTISSFGGSDVAISTVPEIFGRMASENELVTLVDQILDIGGRDAKDRFMDEIVKLIACHSAVRSGQALNIHEIRDILEDLNKTKMKFACCHGRPAMVRIKKEEIDRSVGRLGPDAIRRYKARHRLD